MKLAPENSRGSASRSPESPPPANCGLSRAPVSIAPPQSALSSRTSTSERDDKSTSSAGATVSLDAPSRSSASRTVASSTREIGSPSRVPTPSSSDAFAALESVAREVFALIRPGRGIDVEFGHDAVHRVLEQIGAGRLDFTGGFRLALPDKGIGIMLCLGKGGERSAQQYHHCQQNSAGRFQKTCIFHGASS